MQNHRACWAKVNVQLSRYRRSELCVAGKDTENMIITFKYETNDCLTVSLLAGWKGFPRFDRTARRPRIPWTRRTNWAQRREGGFVGQGDEKRKGTDLNWNSEYINFWDVGYFLTLDGGSAYTNEKQWVTVTSLKSVPVLLEWLSK